MVKLVVTGASGNDGGLGATASLSTRRGEQTYVIRERDRDRDRERQRQRETDTESQRDTSFTLLIDQPTLTATGRDVA